jgi:hypothetical protein
MKKFSRAIIPLLLICITASDLLAQDIVFAVRQSREQGFAIINTDGKTLFNLPPGHDPTVRQTREPFKLSNFYPIDFSDNILPVENGENYYLINKKGEKLRDMGNNYNWISPLRDGYFLGHEKYNNQRSSSMIIYLDKDGNQCFGGKKFWQGTQFREGRALVQLNDDKGEWILMDTTGKEIMNLTNEITGEIRRVAKFERGLWKLTVKINNSYRPVFIRPDGEYSKMEGDLWRYTDARGRPTWQENKLKVDPRITKRVNNMAMWTFPETYKKDSIGYFIFNDAIKGARQPRYVVYTHSYDSISFEKPAGVKALQPYKFLKNYLIMKKIPEQGNQTLVFYDTKDFVPSLEVNEISYTSEVIGGCLIFYSQKGAFDSNTASQVINIKTGKTIYKPGNKSKVFQSLSEALNFKNEVRELKLKGISAKEILQLKEFPNLEILRLENLDVTTIPNDIFTNSPTLRSLTILECPNLKALPADTDQMDNLNNIYLSDCPKLTGFEELIPKLPSLKRIKTDYRFANPNHMAMTLKYPGIKFEAVLKAVRMDSH